HSGRPPPAPPWIDRRPLSRDTREWPSRLHTQKALLDVGVGAELVRGALELDAPLVHDVEAVGEGEGDLEDLLDEENGGAAPIDLAEDLREGVHEQRREPFRRLFHYHELRSGRGAASGGA